MAKAPNASTGATLSSSRRDTCANLRSSILPATIFVWTVFACSLVDSSIFGFTGSSQAPWLPAESIRCASIDFGSLPLGSAAPGFRFSGSTSPPRHNAPIGFSRSQKVTAKIARSVKVAPRKVHPNASFWRFCWPLARFLGILCAGFSLGAANDRMFEIKRLITRTHRFLPAVPPAGTPAERKQRRLMVTALALLLLALASVLYGDREFWFSDREQAGDQTQPESSPHTVTTSAPPSALTETVSTSHKKSRLAKAETKTSPGSKTLAVESSATANPSPVTDPSGSPATVTRTVLPALEVEVVAGDVHRTIHPGTNSVRVDLQPGTAPQQVAQPDSP